MGSDRLRNGVDVTSRNVMGTVSFIEIGYICDQTAIFGSCRQESRSWDAIYGTTFNVMRTFDNETF
jgi:hypothetical protein